MGVRLLHTQNFIFVRANSKCLKNFNYLRHLRKNIYILTLKTTNKKL